MGEFVTITNEGYCHCCRSETTFQSQQSWLRDQYVCLKCFSVPRQRHIQLIFDTYFKGLEKLKLHESSPSNNLISKYCTSYSSSQFLAGVETGTEKDGIRCENLESLTFADDTFDVFITQDVFEHILNPDLAAKEIMRVIKPGGAHVFTVPKYKWIPKSYPRAKIVDGLIWHMKEEMYHGNPVGDGRALVTWDYGDDFEFLIFQWSKSTTTTYVTRDRKLGLDGEHLEVFVTRKPA